MRHRISANESPSLVGHVVHDVYHAVKLLDLSGFVFDALIGKPFSWFAIVDGNGQLGGEHLSRTDDLAICFMFSGITINNSGGDEDNG